MRLIDADELKELILAERDKIPKKVPCATYELMREKDNKHGNAMRGGIRVALRCMENTPTIEAEPVRHGVWRTFQVPKKWNGATLRCSECNTGTSWRWDYCPNCGAKMGGGGVEACD